MTLIAPPSTPDDPNPHCGDCGADLEAGEDHEVWCEFVDWAADESDVTESERDWYDFYAEGE